mmetsp:Transcript_22483/g.58513  ORF Transcript_22483/g.58513 Transcript_22483/m.58513 type:complete len:284 (-) Transcript_22483:52-903(-)
MDIEAAAAMARPAISIAAEAGDLDALRRELTRGVAVDLEDPSSRNTALQLVCGFGNFDYNRDDRVNCVKLLLDHGAAPNAGVPHNPGHGTVQDDQNWAPLMMATFGRPCPKIVKMLIAAGSDVNACIPDIPHSGDWSPLSNAVNAVLVSHIDGETSARIDGLEVVDHLLKAGADPNLSRHWGKTVIYESIAIGVRGLYPLLLRAGAVLPFLARPVTQYQSRQSYQANRADPYFLRVESAGGFQAHETAHREKVLASFTPKFTHLVPPELVPLIVEYVFHFGFY